MPQHYVVSFSKVRPFVDPGYTAEAYVKKRVRESTTPVAVTYNLLLPFLNDFNAKLEVHIKDTEAGKDADEDLLLDAKQSATIALLKGSEFVSRVACQTAVITALIHDGRPLAKSVVYAFDQYTGMHYEYYSRVLEAMYLPKGWALILGAPAKPGELEHFEHRPLSVTAAAEDVLKRHAVMLTTDVIVGTAYAVIYNQVLAVPEARRGAKDVVVSHLRNTAVKYTGSLVGAVIGSRFGGSFEYFGEIVGALASTAILAARLKKASNAAARS
jgi:hypothetical protein